MALDLFVIRKKNLNVVCHQETYLVQYCFSCHGNKIFKTVQEKKKDVNMMYNFSIILFSM
jgi:hypothetical protein